MRSNLSLISAFVASILVNSGAYAQDPDVGATLFADSCSTCHGAAGLGDGDMADVVSIKAPNLTLLKERHDGVFPMLDVIHIIDGRTGVRAHGGIMPVWGQVFSDDAAASSGLYGNVLEARGRIMSLALYLESIQK